MARNFKIPPHESTNLVTTQADIGLMIRAMRNKQSIRIDDAAAFCGVSVSLLSALENNSGRSVGVDKVLNILDQLGLALVITDKSKARDILNGPDDKQLACQISDHASLSRVTINLEVMWFLIHQFIFD